MPVLQVKGAPVSGGNKCPCLGACAQPRGLEKTPPLGPRGMAVHQVHRARLHHLFTVAGFRVLNNCQSTNFTACSRLNSFHLN